jgi:hypothetical protein
MAITPTEKEFYSPVQQCGSWLRGIECSKFFAYKRFLTMTEPRSGNVPNGAANDISKLTLGKILPVPP